ncbi:MAG TPA: M23 family metallopeptidase [Labilithrix sp.]|nr:M23 family metallopeptidase [Labilithrix sp.]
MFPNRRLCTGALFLVGALVVACSPDVIVHHTPAGSTPPTDPASNPNEGKSDEETDTGEEVVDLKQASLETSDAGAPAQSMLFVALCPSDGKISQGFSAGAHEGIDLANVRDTPIFAVGAGVVTDSGPVQGYGQWIRIKHDDGSMTVYGHMHRRDVAVGDRVTPGQRIALMGSEGEASEPKLHLGTYKSASNVNLGDAMDPVEYLKVRGLALPCKPGGEPTKTGTTSMGGAGTVTTWAAGDVRSCERTRCAFVARAGAYNVYPASCYAVGQLVTYGGYTNDKWVKLKLPNTQEGFIPAVLLQGDETGGVKTVCPSAVNSL